MKQIMMKRFALTEKGASDMLKAILAVTLADLALMIPVGLLFTFTGDYLAGELEKLCKNGNVWVLDLKSQLAFMNLDYDSVVYDAGVAAYLLNPLKS